MTALKKKLTDSLVENQAPATSGQRIVNDTQLPGFYLLVGKRAKTYMVRTDVRGAFGERRTVKEKVGRSDEMTATEARRHAQIRIAALKLNGKKKVETVTLREAAEQYVDDCRRRNLSAATIEHYEYSMYTCLAHWCDRPLASLSDSAESRRAVRDEHQRMSRERGPYCANRAFEALRAVYNFAAKNFDDLPPKNPVLLVRFNEEHRADDGLDEEQLAAWWRAVARAENPVRRAFHVFVLLSGHRPSAVKQARWEHLDVRRRVLRIPNPKGGARRAFDMPLSRPMLLALNQAKKAGRVLYAEHARTYIFPGPKGCIVEHKQNILPASHKALRHTYAATAKALGVPPLFLKLLMNHKVTDVTDGYAAGSSLLSALIADQERISRALLPNVG